MKVKCSQCGQRYLARGEAELMVVLGVCDCPRCGVEGAVDTILKPTEASTLDLTVSVREAPKISTQQRRQKT